jgi:SAM-dependent methyltransferase
MSFGEREPRAQALELAAVQPGQRVLDLSGWTGGFALQVASVAASVEVVQRDPELAAEGRRLAEVMGLGNTYFHVGPSHQLPFDAGQFDLVFWCLTLSQEPRPLATLAEIRRVLMPSGRLLLQDVVALGEASLDLRVRELERRREPRHVLFYSEDEVQTLLVLAGLDVAQRTTSGLTQDFAYWADSAALLPGEAEELKRVFFSLSPADQDCLDLALADGQISFAYPVLTLLVEPGPA